MHGDVERAGGLVGNNQRRLQRNGDGDQHALAHTAGELMRILPGAQLRLAETDALKQFDRLSPSFRSRSPAMHRQDFRDLFPDGPHRIERIARVLRHETDDGTANAIQPLLRPAGDVLAIQQNGSLLQKPAFRQKTDQCLCCRTLAGTGLADKRNDLAGANLKIDIVNNRAQAVSVAIGNSEAGHIEDRRPPVRSCTRDRRRHLPILPIARLMRLMEMTTRTTTRPGAAVSHQAVAI